MLLDSLKDKHMGVRLSAIRCFGTLRDAQCVPSLIAILDGETNEEIRFEAIDALANCRKGSVRAIPCLSRCIKEGGEIARIATRALAYIGPQSVPTLIKALQDPKLGTLRQEVAVSLGIIGPDARQAVPALIDAMKDEDTGLRVQVCGALKKVGPSAYKAVPALAKTLSDSSASVRRCAAEALGSIGFSSRTALTALRIAANDADSGVAKAAKTAIQEIEGAMEDENRKKDSE
jgi:HEAT repeat protein